MDHARLLLLAPVLLVYLGFQVRSGMRMRDAALWALLGVYALWAGGLLFFPWVIDPVLRESHQLDLARWVNLVPFATIWPQLHGVGSSPLRQLAGNVGLLTPLGLLGPLVMPSLRRVGRLALVALAVSVGIELVQFGGTLAHVLLRSADVDDVILNVAGALIGWLAWAACSALWRRFGSASADEAGARDLSNKRIEQAPRGLGYHECQRALLMRTTFDGWKAARLQAEMGIAVRRFLLPTAAGFVLFYLILRPVARWLLFSVRVPEFTYAALVWSLMIAGAFVVALLVALDSRLRPPRALVAAALSTVTWVVVLLAALVLIEAVGRAALASWLSSEPASFALMLLLPAAVAGMTIGVIWFGRPRGGSPT